MMGRSSGIRSTHLLRVVEEKALSKEEERQKKIQDILVPDLSEDCVTNILIQLPLDSLSRTRFVCKPWYNIINSPSFTESHLLRSESVLVFQRTVSEGHSNEYPVVSILSDKSNTFSVERNLQKSEPVTLFGHPLINSSPKSSIHFMEFKDGSCEIRDYNVNCLKTIRAACNGLILLDNSLKRGGLIVMNPVTRKLATLPLGTLFPPDNESYGFALSDRTGEYKIVHLFRDELGYVGCEILNLEARFWREVDGPSFGLFSCFKYKPVSAIGALHWVPQVNHSNYIVSMEVDTEKFHTVPLPVECLLYDRIIEMGGFLGLITHKGLNEMDIWILKDFHGHIWAKQHSLTVGGCSKYMVPMLSLRVKGEIIFKNKDGSFYAYYVNLKVTRKFEIESGRLPFGFSFLPHVNSLIPWARRNVRGHWRS